MSAIEAAFPAANPKKISRISNIAELGRRARHLRYLVSHPLKHIDYTREIAGYSERRMVLNTSFNRYKYLGDYMALSFPRSLRRAMILSHYRFVERAVTGAALQAIAGEGLTIWEQALDVHHARIRIRTSESAPMEGEWQLQFLLDGVVLSTLCFVFAPLRHLAPDEEIICLIGGMQGGFNSRAAIRSAAKANHEISPTTMLIIAMKALAAALDVTTIFGVPLQEQVVRRYATEGVKADYDAIWTSEGASVRVAGFYLLSHHLTERDLSDIARSHRRRTKLKRQRKADMLAQITQQARAGLLPPTDVQMDQAA